MAPCANSKELVWSDIEMAILKGRFGDIGDVFGNIANSIWWYERPEFAIYLDIVYTQSKNFRINHIGGYIGDTENYIGGLSMLLGNSESFLADAISKVF